MTRAARPSPLLLAAALVAAPLATATADKAWPSKDRVAKPARSTVAPRPAAAARPKRRAAPRPLVASSAAPAPAPTPEPPPAPAPVATPVPIIVQCVVPAAPAPGAELAAATVAPEVIATRVEASTGGAPSIEATAGYDKGFFIKNAGGYTMTVNARLVSRYAFTSAIVEGERAQTSAFEVPSAPLIIKGQLGSKRLGYKTEIEFGKGFVALKDFYADLGLAGATKLRIGQFTRPFSRQQINSTGSLELADRSITDKAFGAGRDLGAELHNDVEKSPDVEWAFGVFNGTGEAGKFTGSADDDGMVTGGFGNVPTRFRPVVVARVGTSTHGMKGYSEADLEGGAARVAVAGSALVEGDADGDGKSATRVELDTIVKAHGFSASAALYVQTRQEDQWAHRDHESWGFHLQAGYVIAGRHQVVVRAALHDPDHDDDFTSEHALGYTLYLRRHDVKWQTDVGLVHKAGHTLDDGLRARTQLQLGF